MTESEIIENIKSSKKYKSVYIKTIQRIVVDCIKRFGGNPPSLESSGVAKRVEKEAKNLLHQIWGAFYETIPDFNKILDKINSEIKHNIEFKKIILPVLKLQSSVEERIPILNNFYKEIFEITGVPNSIIDQACGLNPLTIPWMSLPNTTTYKAYDIDENEINFLNSVFKLLNIKNAKAEFGDILSNKFEYADVVFMLKLLPCLEHQKKNCSLEILKKQDCKFLVVSFPIKSISGKEKGMASFYGNNFKSMVLSENWEIKELKFETELVFVIKK
jgi:16S rRNA (guanine(1405)-N(7))-methyltransferase